MKARASNYLSSLFKNRANPNTWESLVPFQNLSVIGYRILTPVSQSYTNRRLQFASRGSGVLAWIWRKGTSRTLAKRGLNSLATVRLPAP